MMASFDQPTVQINVRDIVVRCRVSNEYAGKVMLVQFTPSMTSTFNTYPGSEHSECGKIRFHPKEAFEWGMFSNGMDKAIV